jgi:hypothetical protein
MPPAQSRVHLFMITQERHQLTGTIAQAEIVTIQQPALRRYRRRQRFRHGPRLKREPLLMNELDAALILASHCDGRG